MLILGVLAACLYTTAELLKGQVGVKRDDTVRFRRRRGNGLGGNNPGEAGGSQASRRDIGHTSLECSAIRCL